MYIACWSPKGGSGTTVVAALLGLTLARSSPEGALVADLEGDLPAALGVPDPTGPGLGEWLAAGSDVGTDALERLEVDVGRSLRLLPRGSAPGGVGVAARAEALAAAWVVTHRPVVVDCGVAERSPALHLAAAATVSLLVLRPCYLALRKALAAPVRPTGVVLIREEDRVLRAADVEQVLGVPIWLELPHDRSVARAVDAGLLATRIPRAAERPLERALLALAR